MKYRINASTAFVRRYLQVDDKGMVYFETALFSKTRRFSFDQIDFILLNDAGLLSVQIGREVFSVPTKSKDKKHQEAVQMLIREAERTRPLAAPPALPPNPVGSET
jgi:hypothetical protein